MNKTSNQKTLGKIGAMQAAEEKLQQQINNIFRKNQKCCFHKIRTKKKAQEREQKDLFVVKNIAKVKVFSSFD